MALPRCAALALAIAGAVLFAGCTKSPESTDIPPQNYTSRINLIGKTSGSLTGQVVFPSAFTQHSTSFFINSVQLSTLPDGRFWVSSIPAGDYVLRVYVPGFEPIVQSVRIGKDQVTQVQGLALKQTLGKLVGRVVADDGRSAAGAVVRLEPYGLIGSTDRDGIFQFMGVGPGEHMLAVQCTGCERQEVPIRLRANEARNLGIVTVHRRADTAVEPVAPTQEITGG
jgi:hypothetical protein